jgi:hypothetical protein
MAYAVYLVNSITASTWVPFAAFIFLDCEHSACCCPPLATAQHALAMAQVPAQTQDSSISHGVVFFVLLAAVPRASVSQHGPALMAFSDSFSSAMSVAAAWAVFPSQGGTGIAGFEAAGIVSQTNPVPEAFMPEC